MPRSLFEDECGPSLLVIPALRDVVADAGHPNRSPFGAHHDTAGSEQHPYRAVGPHDSMLEREGSAVNEGAAHHGIDLFAILGMNPSEKRLVPCDVRRAQTIDAVHFLRPPQLIRRHIPLPTAHMSNLLRFDQPLVDL